MEYTPFDNVINKFLLRLEKDEDFFNYFHMDKESAMELAKERALTYMCEVLDELPLILSRLDVDFSDIGTRLNEDTSEKYDVFNFKLLPMDYKLLVDLMYTKYMEKDEALLHAFKVSFTPSDLTVFSPSNERKTYVDMLEKLRANNRVMIDKYNSTDRVTGGLIRIDYSKGI